MYTFYDDIILCYDIYSDMAFKWKQIVPINAKFIHHNILYNLIIYDSIEINHPIIKVLSVLNFSFPYKAINISCI